jgi:hypothetical protein
VDQGQLAQIARGRDVVGNQPAIAHRVAIVGDGGVRMAHDRAHATILHRLDPRLGPPRQRALATRVPQRHRGPAQPVDETRHRARASRQRGSVNRCACRSQAAPADEEFDAFAGTVAEGDPAATAQDQLLASQLDLGLAFDRHVGAVRALVDEDELIAATFDTRVHPRGEPIGDHDVVLRIAAERA